MKAQSNNMPTVAVLCLLLNAGAALHHCSEHIQPAVAEKIVSSLSTHHKKINTGFMDDNDPQGLYPLKIKKPPPCGSYSHDVGDLERFYKTAIQVYRHDPTVSPHVVVVLTAVRVRTTCRAHWIGRDELSIVDESVSLFPRLPQGEWEVFHYQMLNSISSYKLGHDSLELLGQNLYSCPWLINPGEKTLYLVRVQVKLAAWSPTGYMVSPYYLKSCRLNSDPKFCNISVHSRVYWDKASRSDAPLIPGIIIGGMLETSQPSISNALCPGVSRFINLKNTFQLSFQVLDIRDWRPETVIGGEPVFISDEGVFFAFLNHDGSPILSVICPAWRNTGGDRERRNVKGVRKHDFSSGFPSDLQTATLEEEISWVRAETEGQLGGLFNRTVKELIDIHFQSCQHQNLMTEIAIGMIALDPRPYLLIKLGHPLFKIQQVGRERYFRSARPVTDITWNFQGVTNQNIPVNFTINGQRRSGFFVCGLGYITQNPVLATGSTDECFLLLHILGGLNLCTGILTPSVVDGSTTTESWIPRIDAPSFSMSDLSYKNHLEEEWFTSTDPKALLQSMGHSFLHENPKYFTLSDYTQLIDTALYWGPIIIGVLLCLKLLGWACGGETSTALRSRVL